MLACPTTDRQKLLKNDFLVFYFYSSASKGHGNALKYMMGNRGKSKDGETEVFHVFDDFSQALINPFANSKHISKFGKFSFNLRPVTPLLGRSLSRNMYLLLLAKKSRI